MKTFVVYLMSSTSNHNYGDFFDCYTAYYLKINAIEME